MPAHRGRSAGWSNRMASTRTSIVDAALRLFTERGFHAVTISEVANAAGVSDRTVYRYFPTKDDLVLEPTERSAFLAALDATPASVPPLAAIAATMRRLAPEIGSVPTEAARIELITTTPSLHAAWIAALSGLETELRGWLARRTDRTVDDIAIVVAVAALIAMHRVLVETWAGTDIGDYHDRADDALRVLGAGLDRSL